MLKSNPEICNHQYNNPKIIVDWTPKFHIAHDDDFIHEEVQYSRVITVTCDHCQHQYQNIQTIHEGRILNSNPDLDDVLKSVPLNSHQHTIKIIGDDSPCSK